MARRNDPLLVVLLTLLAAVAWSRVAVALHAVAKP